jgi:hypothetical protein
MLYIKFIHLTLIVINVASNACVRRRDVIKKFMKLLEGASTIYIL